MRRIAAVLAVFFLSALGGAPAFAQTPAGFTYQPSDPYTGERVTFTTTSCGGGCQYQWADRPPSGGTWALHSGVLTTTTHRFTFNGVGTKYVAVRKRTSASATWRAWRYADGGTARASAVGIFVRQGPRPGDPPPPAACADGQDNDGDGQVDLADPGCSNASDNDETNAAPPPPADTDGDGVPDTADQCDTEPGPASNNGCPLPPPPPPPGGGCDLNATPANFAAQVTAANSGQVVCVGSGDYGTWTGTNKAITVREATGASAVFTLDLSTGDANFAMEGMRFDGLSRITNAVRNLTFRGVEFSGSRSSTGPDGHLRVDNVCYSGILFERATFGPTYSPGATGFDTSRINLPYSTCHSGITVQRSLFVGGNSDGIQTGSGVSLLSNEFRDICTDDALSSNHTDFIQLNNATGSIVRGNWLRIEACVDEQAISGWDGVDRVLIEDNVIGPSRRCIALYSDRYSVVRHNTCYTTNPNARNTGTSLICGYNLPCGSYEFTAKNGASPWPSGNDVGVGTEAYDNILYAIASDSRGPLARNDHNMVRNNCIYQQCAGGYPNQTPSVGSNILGAPSYVGDGNANDARGLYPTTWAGWRLATLSPGKNAASDGADVGVRFDLVPTPGL